MTPERASPSNGTVYLLDTHGMVFQMYHGLPPMTAPDGRAVNAVFGVTRAIMDLYDHGAEYLLATFDCPDKTFRDELFPEYKGHRDPPPEDLVSQEPLIDQVLNAMRIPVLKVPGYEADDIMATVASEAAERGHSVVLCSADKDCRQLLSDKITIRNLRKGVTLDAAGLMADWGVRPDQVIDFQTLVGDSVDNVKGVMGCGPKTAAKWLNEYGTLDNLIANVDKLGGPKLKEAFKKAIVDGTLATSKKLVALKRDVPLTFDWEGWRRRDWDGPRLLELFQDLGFRSYANRVRSTLTASGAKKNVEVLDTAGIATLSTPGGNISAGAKQGRSNSVPVSHKAAGRKPRIPRPEQPTLFDQVNGDDSPSVEPIDDKWVTNYTLIDTPAKFDTLLDVLKQQKQFAIDLETTSLDPIQAEIVGYALCWKPTEAYYLAVRGPKNTQCLDPVSTLAALKPILEDSTVGKTNQNIKYDQLVLRSHGVELAGVVGDSMIAHYLLHSGDRSHNLDDLTLKYFGHANVPISDLIGRGKKQITMAEVPTERAAKYACEDADAAWRLAERLEPELNSTGLRKLYDTLELPLIDVLAELEFNGVLLDLPLLAKLSVEMQQALEVLERDTHALAGKTFNLASPKQLREILFDQMKLPVQKRTGTTNEPSTDQESLEKLAALGHELPKKLISHRQVAKLKGTYVDALPALVNPKTGRLHTSFNQTVASTGRLSSSDPNLQNIPARTEQGRQIRAAFIAPPGWKILTADYSQIELRLLAHFADDDNLRRAFAQDRDIHTSVAAEIFGVPENEVTKDQRGAAKTVNFGVIYGISAVGLSIQLRIDKKAAAKFIDDYFARFPKVLAYQDGLLANARKNGFVSTILGRRRAFDPSAIRPRSSYEQRNAAEREAINMEIQGSAADLMKVAMLNVYKRLKAEERQAKMLLSVHDELVFELPLAEVKPIADLVREEMSNAIPVSVPLKVDVAAGLNWLDVEDVT